jgi:hypothetical protein
MIKVLCDLKSEIKKAATLIPAPQAVSGFAVL